MEPVTKWSPKQVVDWTRGERGGPWRTPGSCSLGDGAGQELGTGVLGPSCRRQSKLLLSRLCAPFWYACSYLSVGVRSLCVADGTSRFKPGSYGMALPWKIGWECGTRDLTPVRVRCPPLAALSLSAEAQGVFVWVTTPGSSKGCGLGECCGRDPAVGQVDEDSCGQPSLFVWVGEDELAFAPARTLARQDSRRGRDSAPEAPGPPRAQHFEAS